MDKEKAKEAIKKIRNCILNDKCELIDCGYYATLSYLEELVEYIDNNDSVIHCKDCAYYDKHRCVLWSMTMDKDFYCASAELKEKNEGSLK